jgi:uncharacterized phage-associated protein
MATVFDVADCLLKKHGPMTAMKLQKLVYYCQAWSLVWDERPMFDNKIEAWANGPVAPALFDAHKGEYSVDKEIRGDCRNLDSDAIDTIDAVLAAYGDKTSQWLSDLTHRESPWRDARKGVPDGTRSSVEITHGAMADYYGNL